MFQELVERGFAFGCFLLGSGYLRFQAQYLRRIRAPEWSHIPPHLKAALIAAGQQGDIEAANRAVFELYGLSQEERSALGGNGT